MNIMSQKVFEISVNRLWTGYMAVLNAEKELNGLNLTFKDTVFGHMESLKDNFVDGVMDLLDVEDDKRGLVSGRLKEFISQSIAEHGIIDRFTDYPHVMYMLFQFVDGKIPWLVTDSKSYESGLKVHRGLSIKDLKPVIGYAVKYRNRSFIIKENPVTEYDSITSILTVDNAAEVFPDTITANFGITDDEGRRLFEDDVVCSGSEAFVLRPNNRYVMQLLENREVNGLHRVRTNYDVFKAKLLENEKGDPV